MFLNIAAFSVYIIVIRSNVLHIINPKIDPKKLSSSYIYLYRINNNFIISDSCFDNSNEFATQRSDTGCAELHRRNIWYIYFIFNALHLGIQG